MEVQDLPELQGVEVVDQPENGRCDLGAEVACDEDDAWRVVDPGWVVLAATEQPDVPACERAWRSCLRDDGVIELLGTGRSARRRRR